MQSDFIDKSMVFIFNSSMEVRSSINNSFVLLEDCLDI
jgi:hypothetical protein